MEKAKTTNKKEIIDIVIQTIGISFIIVSFVYVMTCYVHLPDQIPIHYGLDGIPDNYDDKSFIWSLPVISLLLFIGLNFVSKTQIQYNYTAKTTAKNSTYLKKITLRLLYVLNTIIAFVFFFLTFKTVQIGLGNDTGLGSYFIYFVVVGLFAPIVVYLFLALRKTY